MQGPVPSGSIPNQLQQKRREHVVSAMGFWLFRPQKLTGMVGRLYVGAGFNLSSEGIVLTSDELNNTSTLLR